MLGRNGKPCPLAWSGPGNAYVLCPEVRPDNALVLMWPVPRFTQTFVPQSIPDRKDPLTVRWVGNEVVGVEPRGKRLPMFGLLG